MSRPEVLQRGKSKTENHYMELCYRGKTWTFAKRLRENLLFSKNDNIAFSSSILPKTAQCIHILHTVFAQLFFCTSAPSLCGVVANYLRHPSKSCICAVPPSFKVFALIHSGRADNTVLQRRSVTNFLLINSFCQERNLPQILFRPNTITALVNGLGIQTRLINGS